MKIMRTDILHDISKINFEDLNLICCCAKSNKYYQYMYKIDHLNLIVTGLLNSQALDAKENLTK